MCFQARRTYLTTAQKITPHCILITVGLMSYASVSAETITHYDFVTGLLITTEIPNVSSGDFTAGAGLGVDGGRSGSDQNLYSETTTTDNTLSGDISGDDCLSSQLAAGLNFQPVDFS